jgi:N-acetylglucosamine-6-sulfatase
MKLFFLLNFIIFIYGKPNLVIILTDDQDYMLAGWHGASYNLIGGQGVEFTSFYTHSPVCCVSRSAILTGRYMHNIRQSSFQGFCSNNVFNDTCGCMYINASVPLEEHNLGVYMHQLGYTTGYFGKYLNPGALFPFCNSTHDTIPPGWDNFHIQCYITYFNDTWNINGQVSEFPDYTVAKVGNDSVDWLTQVLSQPNHKPIFTIIAPHAPHKPYTPAPWYTNASVPGSNPNLPSYNYAALNHPNFIATIPPLTSSMITYFNETYLNRERTLLSVDDIVQSVINLFEKEMNNTYFFYVSDNGYHLGEFRLNDDKLHPYEFDIRVPFGIRGPKITPGSKRTELMSTINLPPTWIELGGGKKPIYMDGISFAPLLMNSNYSWDQNNLLIEYSSTTNGSSNLWTNGNQAANNTWRALRIIDPQIGNLTYAEYVQIMDWNFSNIIFYELYNLNTDPFQLNNLYNNASLNFKQFLHTSLLNYWNCGTQYHWNFQSNCPQFINLKEDLQTLFINE